MHVGGGGGMEQIEQYFSLTFFFYVATIKSPKKGAV